MIWQNGKCILCNKETNKNYYFCKDCYHEILQIGKSYSNRNKEDIEKEYKEFQKKYKNDIHIIKNYKYYICNLYALAESYKINYNKPLINEVNKDISEIINICQDAKLNNFNDIDYRNKWPKENLCEDGHYVRSLSEMIIDNWLYNNNIVHAYEKSVFLKSEPEAIILSDFYIPNGNVYIEFWGIGNDEKYIKRKQTKIKLYEENQINRIDLYEKDLKRLDDILPRYLSKYIK